MPLIDALAHNIGEQYNVMRWLVISSVSVLAGTIGGTIGFGSAVLLAPVLSFAFGAAQTVPNLTIAALNNLGREGKWREFGDKWLLYSRWRLSPA